MKDRFSWPYGKSYEREYEDWDSPVTCRLGKFMNIYDLAEKSYCSRQLIISAMEVRMYNERKGKMVKFKQAQFLSEKT